MKSYSKFLLIILIAIFKLSINDKLTPEENLERQENCGLGMAYLEKTRQSEWMNEDCFVWVKTENSLVQLNPSVGTFISPRHVLTSAQSVISNNWRFADNVVFNYPTTCEYPARYLPVSDDILRNMRVVLGPCSSKAACPEELHVEKAYVFGMCDREPNFVEMFRMMILEVKVHKHKKYACTSDSINDSLKIAEVATIKENKVNQRGVQTDDNFDPNQWILTASRNFIINTSRGAPMIDFVDGRPVVIGILGYSKKEQTGSHSYYFNVKEHRHDICSLTGVCHPNRTTTKMMTMTTTGYKTSSESPTILVPLNSDGSSSTTPSESSSTSMATSILLTSSKPMSSSRKLETRTPRSNILDDIEILDDGEEHEEIHNSTGNKEIFGFGFAFWSLVWFFRIHLIVK